MNGSIRTRTVRSGHVVRTVSAVAAAAVAAGAFAAGAPASTDEPAPTPAWNAMEHEARRSLAEAQQRQERVLNPQEHEAHRPPSAERPAGRAAVAGTCAQALSQAWEDLGHFSDGLETYLLGTPACSPG